MREILFRGKKTYNGEWAEGLYIPCDDGSVMIGIGVDDIAFCRTYSVDPDTVGQYTGLTDKKGKKIFEGDIVTVVYEANEFRPLSYGDRGVCVYNTNPAPRKYIGFYIDWGNKSDIKRADIGYWYKRVVVIGNVFDNQELIGGESGDD